jgi:hypothetical protein
MSMIAQVVLADQIFPGGHEMVNLPEVVETLWRLVVIATSATLIGKIAFGLMVKDSFIRRLPVERRLAWAGVLVWMLQTLIIQIQRFNIGITWEGIFLDSIALAIFWVAHRNIRE